MKSGFKIPKQMLACIREDLSRPHSFAYERVGFLTAGAATSGPHKIMLLAREYHPIADADYIRDLSVGAKIGPNAMRLAAQRAYQSRSSLIHIHMHEGRGQPEFSRTDLASGREFAPGFFEVVPRMPHGLVVLSADAATGVLWLAQDAEEIYIDEFIEVGAPQKRQERRRWAG